MKTKYLIVSSLFGLAAMLAFLLAHSFRTAIVTPVAIATWATTPQASATAKTYTVTRPIRETHTKDITYTVTRPVREDRTKTISYTVMNLVRENRTKIDATTGRQITYTVARNVPEQREKVIKYVVTNMVTEQQHKTIAYQTVRSETTELPR